MTNDRQNVTVSGVGEYTYVVELEGLDVVVEEIYSAYDPFQTVDGSRWDYLTASEKCAEFERYDR